MDSISSVSNPRIKAAVRLRERRPRERQGRFLIDGVREIGRALDSQFAVEELFWCPELADPEASALAAQAEQRGVRVARVAPAVIARLTYGDRDDGPVAVAVNPERRLSQLPQSGLGLVAVLEALEKPGNIGAILRSADAAGVDAVIVADGGTDLFNPNTIRASLGVIFSLPVATASSAEARAWLTRQGLKLFAARVDADRIYTQADFRQPAAIVLGSESSGLSEAWAGPNVQTIRLPMLGTADSLNVSTTAAVLFYEARRQRDRGSSAE